VKNLAKEAEKVEKARLNYVAKSKDKDKADPLSSSTSSKDTVRRNKDKFLKFEREATQAATEYRKTISDWEKTRDRWIEEMKSASRVCLSRCPITLSSALTFFVLMIMPLFLFLFETNNL